MTKLRAKVGDLVSVVWYDIRSRLMDERDPRLQLLPVFECCGHIALVDEIKIVLLSERELSAARGIERDEPPRTDWTAIPLGCIESISVYTKPKVQTFMLQQLPTPKSRR